MGGVLGGLAFLIALILLIWFFRRKSKKNKALREKPMNLITDDDDDAPAAGGGRRNELPEYYQPEPFMVPDPTLDTGRSSIGGTNTADDDGTRPLSGTSSSFYTRGTTPEPGASLAGYGAGGTQAGSSTGGERRKGGAPRTMRPVNIIQHDDAGPPEDKEPEGEPETIELPPAYTAVGRGRTNNAAAATTTTPPANPPEQPVA